MPGCIATGATRQEVEKTMKEAMEFHLEGMRLEGYDPPPSRSDSLYVELSS
jgi:predicted RNase H-like HicB family nuclease